MLFSGATGVGALFSLKRGGHRRRGLGKALDHIDSVGIRTDRKPRDARMNPDMSVFQFVAQG